MSWIRNLFSEKIIKICIYISITIVVLASVFFIGRGSGKSSGQSVDGITEIQRAIENINEAQSDQSRALGLVAEQNTQIEQRLNRISELEDGIAELESINRNLEAIINGSLEDEYANRDYIIESAVLVDRNNRLVRSLREESEGAGEGIGN